jgi:dTDP-4-dehydrorhamnose reductase
LVHPLIIGSQGFIGSHFCRSFPQALAVDRSQFDLCTPHRINFDTAGRKVAIIAAALSDPRACEADKITSYQCNVIGTLALGKELLKRGILPIFFSTDYIFDETLQIAPLNTYGQQKAALEKEGAKMGALVIRLSKVYGLDKGDGTLFDTMFACLKENQVVKAAKDQIFAPVFIGDVIRRVMELATNGCRGVVTVVGPTYASRLDMAYRVAEVAKADLRLIEEIALDDVQDGVRRPKRLALKGDFPALSWQDGVKRFAEVYETPCITTEHR